MIVRCVANNDDEYELIKQYNELIK